MSVNIKKLLSICSDSIVKTSPSFSQLTKERLGNLCDDFHTILFQRNGFYAFESALHVFPSDLSDSTINIENWNSENLWQKNYNELMKDYFFFAEDIFGSQFCVLDNKIYLFDPETANAQEMASNFDEWAYKILNRSNFFTGFPLAHEWQSKNGAISTKERLLPKIPFVLGGKFVVDNLYNLNAIQGMKIRADLATQICSLEAEVLNDK